MSQYKWSYWRVIVREGRDDGRWRVWATFALETDANIFTDRLMQTQPSWHPRVLHPDSRLPKRVKF